MKMRILLAAASLAALGATAAPAATIDFSLSPGSFTSYSESGATITAGGELIDSLTTSGGSRGILANGSPRAVFRADFATLAHAVSVDLGDFGVDPDEIFLEAYNSANVLLGASVLTLSANDELMHTLSANFANTSYVLFGSRLPSINGNSVLADNLTFSLSGGGGAVPEPTSWALMIAGFGLAGGALRRRTTRFSIA